MWRRVLAERVGFREQAYATVAVGSCDGVDRRGGGRPMTERVEKAEQATPSPAAGAAAAEHSATPSQLRTAQLPRQLLRGYEKAATDRLLERAAKAIDGLSQVVTQLSSENAELTSARDELQRKFDGAL